jgi:lysozyme
MSVRAKILVAATVVSAASGAGLTAYFEGKVNRVYLDPLGIPTACYGHTGPELRIGQKFTDAQCDAQLAADVAPCWRAADRYVQVPMTGFQQYALTDFCVNAGVGALQKSPMVRYANRGDWINACKAFEGYYTSGRDRRTGERVYFKGLERRRIAEAALCRGEDVILK